MENVHAGSHGKSNEEWDKISSLQVNVTMKMKTNMDQLDTYGLNMKNVRMGMYSAGFVMKSLQIYQIG